MNKRFERCTLAAMMAVGSMAIAGVLSTARAALPRSSTRVRCSTSAVESALMNRKP